MEYALFSLCLFLCVLVFLLAFKRWSLRSGADNSDAMVLMHQQVESLRTDLRDSLHHVTENVGQQLFLVTQQLQSQTNTVGSRPSANPTSNMTPTLRARQPLRTPPPTLWTQIPTTEVLWRTTPHLLR